MGLPQRSTFVGVQLSLYLLCTTVAILTGVAAGSGQGIIAGAALVTLGAGVALLAFPLARLTVIVAGALLVFQGDSTGLKFMYLVLAFSTMIVSRSQSRDLAPLKGKSSGGLSITTGLFAASLIIAGIISQSSGRPIEAIARDMLPYVLLIILPAVGAEVGSHLSPRTVYLAIFVTGAIAAVALAIDWAGRRGAADSSRVLLSSTMLCTYVLSVALIQASRTRSWQRVWLVLLVAVITSSLIISGSRTYLIILVATVLVCLATPAVSGFRRSYFTNVGLVAILGLTMVTLTTELFLEQGYLADRLMLVERAFGPQGLTADLSFQARAASYSDAQAQWLEGVVFGSGFGYVYPSGGFSPDTPMLVLAKLGLFGTAALVAYVYMSVRMEGAGGPTFGLASSSSLAWLAAATVALPFGAVFEDKGFALVLALIAAAGAAERASAQRERADIRSGPLNLETRSPIIAGSTARTRSACSEKRWMPQSQE